MTDTPPERAWVTDPKALEEARALIAALRPVLASYHERRADLLQRYTEKFFDLDLIYLAERFAGPYRSWLRFFNFQFRRDRRAIRVALRIQQKDLRRDRDRRRRV